MLLGWRDGHRHSAPAVARGEIEVAGSPEIVWDILTDISKWPNWNPDVKSASLEGPLAKGTKFRWKSGPGTITSTLQSVEPPRLIAWTGTTFEYQGKTRLSARTAGRRHHRQIGGVVDGLLVRLLRRSMAKTLQKAVESGLLHLKSKAEGRAAG